MPRLKIVHSESHRQWGGQERRVFHECLWMKNKGHRVILLAPATAPVYRRAARAGIEVHDLTFRRVGVFQDMLKVRKLLRRIRPDVLNTHGNIDSKVVLTAAQGLGIAHVLRTRHSTPRVHNSWYNRLLYRKFSHYIFTTADCTTRQLQQDFDIPADHILTLPGCIVPPITMLSRAKALERLTTELHLPGDARFIGYVGRLSREKGLDVLLEAFITIAALAPSHHLVLVGNGGYAAELLKRIKRSQMQRRIHLIGYRDNVWDYLRAFDCHALASPQHEGIPQVILQAMIAECPVIGARAGGIPDVIAHGCTGWLVPPHDSRTLAAMLLKTIRTPESTISMISRARDYALKHHTIDVMGARILEIYRL